MITGLIIIVAIIFCAQIVRVFEVSNIITKEKNEVSDQSNLINGLLLLISGFALIAFFFWQCYQWMYLTIQNPASEHGQQVAQLWDTTMGLIVFVFLILTPMLFGFAWWFRGRKNNTASYITHNNKLEIFWTAIPAVVLLVLIIYGLNVWGKIVNQDISDAIVIELYAQQFEWNARYAGEDNKLGDANVRFVDLNSLNILGVISKNNRDRQIALINESISQITQEIAATMNPAAKELKQQKIKEEEDKKHRFNTYFSVTSESQLKAAEDDLIIQDTIYLPVGEKVLFKFRSQDVIHSAYIPDMFVQMNCVPGTVTQFAFTPTMTTSAMRQEPQIIKKYQKINEIHKNKLSQPMYNKNYEDLDSTQKNQIDKKYYDLENNGKKSQEIKFDYTLLCNKICGNKHYDMKMTIVVDSLKPYNMWLENQKENQFINF